MTPALRKMDQAKVWATSDGFTVLIWPGAYTGAIVAELIPPPGRTRTAAGLFNAEADVLIWAEARIEDERSTERPAS